MTFYGFDHDPMTLILIFDPDMVKMYPYAQHSFSSSKVTVGTQIDMTENISCPYTRMIINEEISKEEK